MAASVDYSAFTALLKRMERAPKELQQELTDTYHEAGPRIVAEIKGSAFTRIQHRAASTVTSTNLPDGIELKGGGGGLGGALFAGGEFGGRKSQKEIYAKRSPNGRAYVVRRRVTMQFLPHLGTEGYFFWPTVRRWLPKLLEQQKATIERVVGGGS